MSSEEISPAMKQFVFFKQKYPDCLILFRMGDFYETFYDDAKLASKVLGITLTKRGTKTAVPLAGIPHHALDQYLVKLIRAGIKCAICEQIENPKFAKGVVKRDVIKVVTPGTIIDKGILSDKSNNYLVSLYFSEELMYTTHTNIYRNKTDKFEKNSTINKDKKLSIGMSIVDLSTGEFLTTEISEDKIMAEINRINPAEIIFPSTESENNLIKELKTQSFYLNEYEDRFYFYDIAYNSLKTHFHTVNLEGFGIEGKKYSVPSAGALLSYLMETQKTSLTHINKIKYFSTSTFMILDKSTMINLEIIKNIKDGSTKDTLLETLDRTFTPMGSRLLIKWLISPLLDIDEINQRLEAVDFLFRNILLRQELKELLSKINDIERLISRINYGNANARDVLSLKNSLKILPELKVILRESNKNIEGNKTNNILLNQADTISDLKEIVELIEKSIKDDPPQNTNEGNMIKKGYNSEIDELHDICINGRTYIKDIEEKEKSRTGIKSLRISFNNVFGYFIEVTKPNLHLLPKNPDGSLAYIRKQTTSNSERFITEELKQYEEKILGAEEKINLLELELFKQICQKIIEKTSEIQDASNFIAQLDVLFSFAIIASEHNYVKPFVDNKFSIKLEESRHPVIERIEKVYIPNDIFIGKENKTMIITGPNMAGKSTVMRQVALIVLMAQIGSFVPAKKAEIGIVDRIFTRVGAHDDLTHGQSTFMVEMNETASILNNATEKSLIIMDEIGRGTSTFDGVSIAWSVAEYLNKQIKAKTMFATHYHVLTKLDKFEGVKNYNIAVKENKDDLIFLRKLVEGGTDRSFGIHVAKLAGMPTEVIEKAKEIQYKLEVADNMRDKIIVERRRKQSSEPQLFESQSSKQSISEKKKTEKDENSNSEDEMVEFTKLRQKKLVDL